MSLPHIFQFNPFTKTFKLHIPIGENSEIAEANKWAGIYSFSV